MTLEQRGIVRLRYRARQRLASDDLLREVADPTELQWWHNRSVHDAFGVVSGLETRLVPTGAEVLVELASGLAYDGYGRPLTVRRRVIVELPTWRANQRPGGALLLRAPSDDPWVSPVPGRATDVRNPPEVCWAEGQRISVRDGVPLACLTAAELATLPALSGPLPERIAYDRSAKALIGLGRLSESDLVAALALSTDVAYADALRRLYAASQACIWPRRARRIARSRLVTGMTIPGDTAWQPWLIRTPLWASQNFARQLARSTDLPIGFQVRVDTSAHGFTETPRYFAWLQGPLFAVPAQGLPEGGVHWDHVDDAGPRGFTFYTSLVTTQVLAAFSTGRDLADRPLGGAASDLLHLLRAEPFHVAWLAVTTADLGDCRPAEDPPDPCDERPDPCADEVIHGHAQ
jgi:hypothetical protein